MLIVRGVNVFPSALREVVNEFSPETSGALVVRAAAAGVRQEPPLPVTVEARDAKPTPASLNASSGVISPTSCWSRPR